MRSTKPKRDDGTLKLASSHFVTTCATFGALTIFVAMGSQVVPEAIRSLVLGTGGNSPLKVAFILNIAIILFGWRRAKDLREALQEKTSAQREAYENAYTDHTTGLANRRRLTDALSAELERSNSDSTLLFLDLDHFKKVNDMYGHCAGDEVLRFVGTALQTEVPRESCCARLGGDEFAALIKGHDTDISEIAERIIRAVSGPIAISNATAHISASIGLAKLDSAIGAEDVLRRADIAMYSAKTNGRNCFAWFDTKMAKSLRNRVELEEAIKTGIERGEFVPYFQPLIQLETGDPIGFEVLARWHRPLVGVVEPPAFMKVAEATGLISPLSLSVMRQALLKAKDWPAHLKIAVNVSPLQFRDHQLAERILKILAETGFPAGRLELEITETAIVDDREVAETIVRSLKNYGISLSLDDFGTGYASLAQLQSLPFDRIKIDRSFVASILTDSQNAAIVETITSLGRSLDLRVIAEGVESEEVSSKLRDLGCADAQGFLYGKAMPAEQVAGYLGGQSEASVPIVSSETERLKDRRDQSRRPAQRRM